MNIRVPVRMLFILWVVAVAVLSVISYPGSKDLLMSVKLTSSGFVVHGVAYFVGILLCYFSFNKKKDPSETPVCDREPFGLFHGASGDRITEQGDLSQGMVAFGKDGFLRNWNNNTNVELAPALLTERNCEFN